MTNAECRMTNDGFASLSLFKQTEYIIRISMFDVGRSMFDVH
ncbi:L-carnitine dehydratase/bile acid-inducible protein F (EC [Olavius algarvensis Delta 1 endosymbiont]|nr:L-carnitine dehydratase/bile acid-inducible protein F (EC [Olavius algarvensis Delta 1 endosymbiont]